MSADTGRALTCSTTFVSWGTTVTIREPRSTLRRVSLLGAAALLRLAWRAGDNIYQHTWHMQHSAPFRTSYVVGARQGSTGPTKPPVQQQSSTTPDGMRPCGVLITAEQDKQSCVFCTTGWQSSTDQIRIALKGVKGPLSCCPASTKVIMLLKARYHQKLFLQWFPSLPHTLK